MEVLFKTMIIIISIHLTSHVTTGCSTIVSVYCCVMCGVNFTLQNIRRTVILVVYRCLPAVSRGIILHFIFNAFIRRCLASRSVKFHSHTIRGLL